MRYFNHNMNTASEQMDALAQRIIHKAVFLHLRPIFGCFPDALARRTTCRAYFLQVRHMLLAFTLIYRTHLHAEPATVHFPASTSTIIKDKSHTEFPLNQKNAVPKAYRPSGYGKLFPDLESDQMSDQVFTFSVQIVNDRHFYHCIAAGLLKH